MSKSAEAPASLVKYEPAVKIYESMRSYHQRPEHEEASSDMPPKVEGIFPLIFRCAKLDNSPQRLARPYGQALHSVCISPACVQVGCH